MTHFNIAVRNTYFFMFKNSCFFIILTFQQHQIDPKTRNLNTEYKNFILAQCISFFSQNVIQTSILCSNIFQAFVFAILVGVVYVTKICLELVCKLRMANIMRISYIGVILNKHLLSVCWWYLFLSIRFSQLNHALYFLYD